MNTSYNTIRPLPNITKIGGTPSTMQRISEFMTWKTIAIIVVILILSIIGYYTYTQFVDSQTSFKANRENFSKDKNSNKTATLMLFYVDWCPHCKTAKPEWESLKSEYDGKMINGYTISFVEHNCTTESDEVSDLMDKYSIEGYPTIKLVKDNQIIEYDAKPTKSTMEQFLNTVL
jgi:thiol-disulfide isomerase/thioredoxin